MGSAWIQWAKDLGHVILCPIKLRNERFVQFDTENSQSFTESYHVRFTVARRAANQPVTLFACFRGKK